MGWGSVGSKAAGSAGSAEKDATTVEKDATAAEKDASKSKGSSGKSDNNNGNSDGSGIDVNGSRPTDPALASAYDEKKMLVAQGKADGMNAEQLLRSSIAEIKQWADENGKTSTDIA